MKHRENKEHNYNKTKQRIHDMWKLVKKESQKKKTES